MGVYISDISATGTQKCKCAYICTNCEALNVEDCHLSVTGKRHSVHRPFWATSRDEYAEAERKAERKAEQEARNEVEPILTQLVNTTLKDNFKHPHVRLSGCKGICSKCNEAQPWSDALVDPHSVKERYNTSKVWLIVFAFALLGTLLALALSSNGRIAVMLIILGIIMLPIFIVNRILASIVKKNEKKGLDTILQMGMEKYARYSPIVTNGTLDLSDHKEDPRCQALLDVNEADCSKEFLLKPHYDDDVPY